MKLELNGLRVTCVIGDKPDERVREQTLRLDVALIIASEKACTTDRLEDTVDYARLAESIAEALRTARCAMLERAAEIVARLCLKVRLVSRVEVSVAKFESVPGLDSARVTLIRSKERLGKDAR